MKSPESVAIAASIVTIALTACTSTRHPDVDGDARTKKPCHPLIEVVAAGLDARRG